jgi:pSer/pThr/pTyr-binding forkhead associated (FHA) protein
VLEPVSVALKFGFLAVLYLFLLWVVRSSLKDLRRAAGQEAVAAPSDATGLHSATAGLASADGTEPRLQVERAVNFQPGSAFDLRDAVVLGRGGGADIQLEDTFASAQHARIVARGSVMVLEDLGSTNGTYLNDEPLRGPQPLHPGDRIRIGDTEFSFWS